MQVLVDCIFTDYTVDCLERVCLLESLTTSLELCLGHTMNDDDVEMSRTDTSI